MSEKPFLIGFTANKRVENEITRVIESVEMYLEEDDLFGDGKSLVTIELKFLVESQVNVDAPRIKYEDINIISVSDIDYCTMFG